MKIRISMLSQEELAKITERENMTEEQKKLLLLLHSNKKSDTGIMQELHLGGRKYYQLKREVHLKVIRQLLEMYKTI